MHGNFMYIFLFMRRPVQMKHAAEAAHGSRDGQGKSALPDYNTGRGRLFFPCSIAQARANETCR